VVSGQWSVFSVRVEALKIKSHSLQTK